MKRLMPRKWAINKAARERASVTLETALVMPMFLLFVFFLLFLVQTSATMMALHGALSQSVRMTAAAWYPVSLIQSDRAGQESASGSATGGAAAAVGAFAKWLPAPLNRWAEALSVGSWSPDEEAAKLTLRELAARLADQRMLDADRLRITDVDLPQAAGQADAFLMMQASYRLPMRVPWTGRVLTVRASAKERAWIGGSPSKARLPDEDAAPLDIAFLSLEPNPVRPGRKATLVLQTRPGASLDLSVIYKSGQSQAKHLGMAVADESGRISWTWHVSGNTTSGEWTWAVHGEGGASYSQAFRVERATDK